MQHGGAYSALERLTLSSSCLNVKIERAAVESAASNTQLYVDPSPAQAAIGRMCAVCARESIAVWGRASAAREILVLLQP